MYMYMYMYMYVYMCACVCVHIYIYELIISKSNTVRTTSLTYNKLTNYTTIHITNTTINT